MSRVVVTVNDERDARTLRKESGCRSVDVPLIQRYRRRRHVVVVGLCVSREFSVVEKAVGPPVQIGVVEEKARLRLGLLPRELRREKLLQEVSERQQSHESTDSKLVAKRFARGELCRPRAGHVLHPFPA